MAKNVESQSLIVGSRLLKHKPQRAHDESSGGDGHVFEVLINSKPYALKIVRRISGIDIIRYSELITILQFKFYDPSEDRGPMSEKENRRVPDSVLEGHMDPFYAECRMPSQWQQPCNIPNNSDS
jgi:hypothetical protein